MSTEAREVQFWAAVARGASSEDAAMAAGVSAAVGVRWFREAGGMPSVTLAPASGRYLSFAEREEIAILHAGGAAVRQIVRRLSRSASISRELRRNAAPAVAGWRIGPRRRSGMPTCVRGARSRRSWSSTASCASTCRTVVSGAVKRPDGAAVDGPHVPWNSRRRGRRKDRRWAQSWSPEQISNRLRIDFPDDESIARLA